MNRKRNGAILKRKKTFHRGFALILSIPLCLMALTGILLNHSKTLNLSDLHLTNRLLLSWYAVEPKDPSQALHIHNKWLTKIEDSLYLDGTHILSNIQSLTGAVSLGNQLVVSSSHTIYLIDSSTGELLEKLGSESLPEGKIKRIDLLENGLLLETSSGIFQSNADFTLFSPHAQVHLPPLHFQTPPAALLSRILQDWRGQGIHLERILLDLHTGRIFGSLGSYLLDLVGIATLILLYSGISLWWRIPRK